jgi:hypothetical protein
LSGRREGDKQRERDGIWAKQGHDNSRGYGWLAMAGLPVSINVMSL